VTDLDRTLLRSGGGPTASARAAVRGIHSLGLPALLVSGRTYSDLRRLAPGFGAWDGLVAEDGAVVEAPVGRPPAVSGRRVASAVRARLVANPRLHPELGEVVASVPLGERDELARTVAALPVELVHNIDRVMVSPRGITKSSGVRSALRRLGLPGSDYAAIGDAENDLEVLRGGVLSGAVANALPSIRSVVDYICRRPFDRGVLEFVNGPLRERVRADPPVPGR
jgi:hydroxymethylpyrimidine pyrophosphatase-like HAD family hydrolase